MFEDVLHLSCENFIVGWSNPRSKTDFYNIWQELNCPCPQRSLSIDDLHLLAFVEIRLFNVFFFLEEKNGIRDSDKKSAGCGILARNRGMRDQDHPSRLSQRVPHKTRPYTIDGNITLNWENWRRYLSLNEENYHYHIYGKQQATNLNRSWLLWFGCWNWTCTWLWWWQRVKKIIVWEKLETNRLSETTTVANHNLPYRRIPKDLIGKAEWVEHNPKSDKL